MTTPAPFPAGDRDRPLAHARKALFWTGAAMIVLGIAALALPLVSTLVVAVFVGWLLMLSGLIALIGAFALRGTGLFGWQLAAGLLALTAGVLLLVFPAQGLVALTLVVAVVLFMTGVAQAALALWMRPAPGWLWGALSAGVSMALGALILVTLPEASAVMLGILVGVDFLSTGVACVLIAQSALRA